MKKISIILSLILLASISLLIAEITHIGCVDVIKKGVKQEVEGKLYQKDGEWYLKDAKQEYLMHFGPAHAVEYFKVELKEQDNFKAKGYYLENNFAITSFDYEEKTIKLRDEETGAPLWAGDACGSHQKNSDKYSVKPDKCISCKICVSKCPTKAISMVDGKAVIDPEKCINCGICAKACPTKAIKAPGK